MSFGLCKESSAELNNVYTSKLLSTKLVYFRICEERFVKLVSLYQLKNLESCQDSPLTGFVEVTICQKILGALIVFCDLAQQNLLLPLKKW